MKNGPLFEATTKKGEKVTVQSVFSRTELSRSPIAEYLPERHYNDEERWYAIMDGVGDNCMIGRYEEIDFNSLKYIGDV